MRSFGDLCAARLAVREHGWDEPEAHPKKIRVALPRDGWHAAIVELCMERFRYACSLYQEAMSVFQADLHRRESSDGYVYDGLPVRISWGVGKMASLIDDSESRLNQFKREIEMCRQQATFGTDDSYDQLARQWLRRSRDLRRRVEYTLQASMWVQWTVESLWQANQLAGHLLNENSNHLSQYGPSAFSYLSHPPLLVAVMSAASMVEEVGAFTVKELETGISPEMDETALKEVLEWISACDLAPDDVDLEVLDDRLRGARNDLAHSMMARSTTITIETFEAYFSAVFTAINLTNHLAKQLLADVLTDLYALPATPRRRGRYPGPCD